jgi:hypothetical protein
MRAAHHKRVGWIAANVPGYRTREWQNAVIGLSVRHCGHPTALRPYYVTELLTELGAFSLLAAAMRAAELAYVALQANDDALADDWTCYSLRMKACGLEPSRKAFERIAGVPA